MNDTGVAPRLLAPAATADLTSLSWRQIQREIRSGKFPQPVRISRNRIAFLASEVADWIASRPRVMEAA